MEEGDAAAAGTDPRHIVDETKARRPAALQQLDLDVAQGYGDDRRTVDGLGSSRLEAENVPVKAEGGVDGRNGDADVGDAGGWLAHGAPQHNDCTRGSGRIWQRNISRPLRTPPSGWRSNSTRGSRSWTSGQPGAGRAIWWRRSWTSWRESMKAS